MTEMKGLPTFGKIEVGLPVFCPFVTSAQEPLVGGSLLLKGGCDAFDIVVKRLLTRGSTID